MAKILKAFPKFNKSQLEILRERFKELSFTDQRIMDAVNHVIDTYEGWDKLPNIANFVQYDKYKHLLTYNDVLNRVQSGEKMSTFKMYEGNKNYWYQEVRCL
jgi:hypothetical protein